MAATVETKANDSSTTATATGGQTHIDIDKAIATLLKGGTNISAPTTLLVGRHWIDKSCLIELLTASSLVYLVTRAIEVCACDSNVRSIQSPVHIIGHIGGYVASTMLTRSRINTCIPRHVM
jgi:hypothetical protein